MVMLISRVTYMENNEELFVISWFFPLLEFGTIVDQGRPLPKFGEWDVNDPASADGFTVIFNKARDEKKTGGKPESLEKADTHGKPGADPNKPQSKKWLCCVQAPQAES
ncbi:hypothetical protein GOBAR_AA23744 [Gossypium barbadense]|uniref:RIN4 pathogenic type III effector avirulence factor Avr cleavage site domain-containing protein n=1 Tax=Gossypium barbadense TaxID=3634 RepID=A0A2P5X0Q3_GOSBA|nr:hypothetical protein GOBAR_AA23744 [Gossypium barbadense]